ncbi:hypothetical protein, partial [Kocuria rosea]
SGAIAAAQLTRIFFTDVIMVPSLDEERPSTVPNYLGSPSIQRTNSLLPGFGPPALGDQTASGNVIAVETSIYPVKQIILPKSSSGFYYITSLFISAPLIQSQYSTANGGTQFTAEFDDLTNGNPIAKFSLFSYLVPNTSNFDTRNPTLINAQNMNLRLDATHDYGFSVTSVVNFSGTLTTWELFLSAFLSYTLNPN